MIERRTHTHTHLLGWLVYLVVWKLFFFVVQIFFHCLITFQFSSSSSRDLRFKKFFFIILVCDKNKSFREWKTFFPPDWREIFFSFFSGFNRKASVGQLILRIEIDHHHHQNDHSVSENVNQNKNKTISQINKKRITQIEWTNEWI